MILSGFFRVIFIRHRYALMKIRQKSFASSLKDAPSSHTLSNVSSGLKEAQRYGGGSQAPEYRASARAPAP